MKLEMQTGSLEVTVEIKDEFPHDHLAVLDAVKTLLHELADCDKVSIVIQSSNDDVLDDGLGEGEPDADPM